MSKKLTYLVVAISALGLVGPALADASEATYPAGTRAAIGQEISMTGKRITLKSASLGSIYCGTLTLYSKIAVNNGTTIMAPRLRQVATTSTQNKQLATTLNRQGK